MAYLRERSMEAVGLHVHIDAAKCKMLDRAGHWAGLSGVVIGHTDDGCSIIQLDEASVEDLYQRKHGEWEQDQRSIWSAVRARPEPQRERTFTVFSGTLSEVVEAAKAA